MSDESADMSKIVQPKRTQRYLDARAIIAMDLWKERKISRDELLRLETDAAEGRDTGDIRYLEKK